VEAQILTDRDLTTVGPEPPPPGRLGRGVSNDRSHWLFADGQVKSLKKREQTMWGPTWSASPKQLPVPAIPRSRAPLGLWALQ